MEIVRNLTRRKVRSGLTITGIVIGIFALTTMGAIAEHFNALFGSAVEYFGSAIQVSAPDGVATPLLPMSTMDKIKQVDGVAAVFPGYSFAAKPGSVAVNFGVPDTIVAGEPTENSWGALRTSIASGRSLTPGTTGDVVLGSAIATEFKKKVGDTITLPVKPSDARPGFLNHAYRVVGILNPTGTAPDNLAYLTSQDGQQLLKDSLPAPIRDTVDVSQMTEGITVYGKPGSSLADLDRLADRINAEVPGVKATQPSQLVDAYRSGGATFAFVTTGAAVLALVIGGLSVINTMIMAVNERTREIGLKKAVGAHMRHLLFEYLAEATLIGLFGGLVGYLLGVGLTNLINAAGRASGQELFLITPALTALAIGFAVVLGALAGLIPAFRAARLDPVTALRMAS